MAATKTPTIPRSLFTKKWLESHHQNRSYFPDELYENDGPFTKEKLLQIIDDLKKVIAKKVENDPPRLLFEDFVYAIQVTGQMPPHVPIHYTRVTLLHSILEDDAPICLFVKDLKRERKPKYDQTIRHYEAIIKKLNLPYNISVMPISQLYNEYPSYESRRKLTYLFDKFIVDKSVSTPVNAFLGQKLMREGRFAMPVDMTVQDIADEIDRAVRTVFYSYKIYENGRTQNIKIGRQGMSNDAIAENIIDFMEQLGDVQPGGVKNVNKVFLKPCKFVPNAVQLYTDDSLPVVAEPEPMDIKTEDNTESADQTDPQINDEVTEDEKKLKELEHLIERCQTDFHAIIGDHYISGDFDDSPEETKYPHFEPLKSFANDDTSDGAAKDAEDNGTPRSSKKKKNNGEDELSEQIMENLKKLLAQGKLAGLTGGSGGSTANNPIRRRGGIRSTGGSWSNGRRF